MDQKDVEGLQRIREQLGETPASPPPPANEPPPPPPEGLVTSEPPPTPAPDDEGPWGYGRKQQDSSSGLSFPEGLPKGLVIGVGTAAFVVGLIAGAVVFGGGGGADPEPVAAEPETTVSDVVLNGNSILTGRIDGTLEVDGVHTSFPGQSVTAPAPTAGEAVGWQWQKCAGEEGDMECRPIDDATEQEWTSPPTEKAFHYRVLVTVDFDGGRVTAPSPTATAAPWPDGVPLGNDAATTTTTTTTTTAPPPPPTIVDEAGNSIVVDEAGNPVLDEAGNPVIVPAEETAE